MIANVILGVNVDTTKWISDLKEDNSDEIYVIDYDHIGESILKEGVIYTSPSYGKKHFSKFDSLYFYKSMYIYPGMNGKMSSLHKK